MGPRNVPRSDLHPARLQVLDAAGDEAGHRERIEADNLLTGRQR
jgi:hypothetical protein